MFKRILAAIAMVMALVLMSGCSTVSTAPDEVALHYKGGALSSQKYAGCVGSSDRAWDGPGDAHYVYPKGQRTFSFTGAEGAESYPISVTTGSQEVQVPGFVTFTLNTDCEVLREFHERIGKKYGAYVGGGGWDEFLSDYVAVPLDAIMNEAAGAIKTPEGVSVDQNWYYLYTNAQAQNDFAEYVKENLPGEIEAALGEKYITVNKVNITKPKISDELKGSLAAKEKARLDNDAQKERNTIAKTKYDTLKDCRDKGISEASCITVYLAEQGDIPFYPIPQGGNINLAPGK